LAVGSALSLLAPSALFSCEMMFTV